MAIKKSQLYASLWQSCDELRGGMDASQYKDYILTLLFMKYVSDKAERNPYQVIQVPEGGSFADMVELRGNPEIGDKINKIIAKFAEANEQISDFNQADFNDPSKLGRGQEMVDRLSKLIAIFNNLDLGANRAEGDDLLGDAYEYLMRHFATESGKSKGQFYTPAEVSRIMAKVIGLSPDTTQEQTIYDPTCGSGSLLLKAADEAPNGITVYGQEKDNATYALARMNMILHNNATADIKHGNTLAAPEFTNDYGLDTFDFAVANPPFSDKAWTTGLIPAHKEIREILSHELFEPEDLESLATNPSYNFRTQFAQLKLSSVIDDFTASEIADAGKGVGFLVQLSEDGKQIVFPSKKSDAYDLLRFLNDGYVRGVITKIPYIANSKRKIET